MEAFVECLWDPWLMVAGYPLRGLQNGWNTGLYFWEMLLVKLAIWLLEALHVFHLQNERWSLLRLFAMFMLVKSLLNAPCSGSDQIFLNSGKRRIFIYIYIFIINPSYYSLQTSLSLKSAINPIQSAFSLVKITMLPCFSPFSHGFPMVFPTVPLGCGGWTLVPQGRGAGAGAFEALWAKKAPRRRSGGGMGNSSTKMGSAWFFIWDLQIFTGDIPSGNLT